MLLLIIVIFCFLAQLYTARSYQYQFRAATVSFKTNCWKDSVWNRNWCNDGYLSFERSSRISPLRTTQKDGSSESVEPVVAPAAEDGLVLDGEKVPRTLDLLKFGIPTLGIWLLQPILSLIDSSVVGMSGSATGTTSIAQLAALGPGIAWIDSSSYLFQFMGMATTSLYATALSKRDEKESEKVLSHSVVTALLFGVMLMTVQFLLAGKVISSLSGAAVESIPFGITYARIRSLAAPIALPTIVGQAAFLAGKDAVTPLKSTLIGAFVNLFGDILLVTVLGQGIAGAAWATAASQLAGGIYLIAVAIRNVMRNEERHHLRSMLRPEEPVEHKGIISGMKLLKSKISWPTLNDIRRYLSFCGPLFAVLLVKTFLWTYTTYAASAAGAVDLAAHQLTINVFLAFCIFGDVMSQISQTFLPYFLPSSMVAMSAVDTSSTYEGSTDAASSDGAGVNASDDDRKYKNVLELLRRVLVLSGVIGISNSIACQLFRLYGNKLFTNSIPVLKRMGDVSALLSIATLPHAMMLSMEGVLLALRDYKFQSYTYMSLGALFITYQSLVRKLGLGVVGVWAGTATFQYTRFLLFSSRVSYLLRRQRRKAAAAAAEAIDEFKDISNSSSSTTTTDNQFQ